MVLTLRFFVLYGSQNKEQILHYTSLSDFFITCVEYFDCAVQTSPYIRHYVSVLKDNHQFHWPTTLNHSTT